MTTVYRPARWRAVRLVLFVGGLVATVAALHALGSGQLAAPPLRSSGWGGWAQTRDPLTATMAILRLAALALAWYLLLATLAGTAARLLRSRGLVAITDVLTPPAIRRFLRDAVSVSLATAVIATGPSAARHDVAHATATTGDIAAVALPGISAPIVDTADDDVDALPGSTIPLPLDLASRGAPATTTTDPRDDDGPTRQPRATPRSGEPIEPIAPAQRPNAEAGGGERPPAAAQEADAQRAAVRTRTVAPGESLWSIARDVLVATHAHEPTDTLVVAYWRALIEANRSSLADPGNPDLIFPGDELVLPELPDAAVARR